MASDKPKTRHPAGKNVSVEHALRAIPGVDTLIASDPLKAFTEQIAPAFLAAIARDVSESYRKSLLSGKRRPRDESIVREEVAALVAKEIRTLLAPSLRHVINCTGVVLHTGLGRAVMPEPARERLQALMAGYQNLEIDLGTGRRGDRTIHVERLICLLSGAEAACIVNNNAAAVLLALNSLANRKEVVISRGELVEIGGSFRIPDVMAKSGARMREVGTTNKTHPHDFTGAVGPRTAGFLHVHTSNYRVEGFTAAVPLAELVRIARQHDIFVMHDLGGGILTDLTAFGLPPEPLVSASIDAGADIVTFSGDKMLGGPQCGLIAGRADLVRRIRRNPMMRAMRCDKMTIAALEETLKLFLAPGGLSGSHPVMRMLTIPAAELRARGAAIVERITDGNADVDIEVVDSAASAGSGTLPLTEIASCAIRVRASGRRLTALARRLRTGDPAVLGYVRQDALFLDLRAVSPSEDGVVASALIRALS